MPPALDPVETLCARVVRDVPNGTKIASVVRTDHLIVAGTPDWGAWGVAAHPEPLVDKDL